jgi:hypothetical protein
MSNDTLFVDRKAPMAGLQSHIVLRGVTIVNLFKVIARSQFVEKI